MGAKLRLSHLAWAIAVIGVAFLFLNYVGAQGRRDCGYPRLRILAWVDSDADGQKGPGEAPLAGVVVRVPATHGYGLGGTTGADGLVPASRETFAPCGLRWQGAEAVAPAGYIATTPAEIRAVREEYDFGFRTVP